MALVHILDRQTDMIVGTLSTKNADYWNDTRRDSLNNENTFDFIANAAQSKSILLEKRNRLLIQDEDGYFREYIIIYSEQFRRNEKDVRSNASFSDLARAKVIEPQILEGATSSTAIQTALEGTEWQPGIIDYTFIRTITVDKHTNPLALLKTIASTFELEINYRVEISGNRVVGRYVDMQKETASFEGKEITFGKDLIGVKRKEDSSQIVTALLGIGPEKEDGTRLTVLVENKEALQRWGRNGQHLIEPYEPQSSDQEMTLERLQTLTENELEKRIDAIVSYECEAASLERIFGREHEKIRKGQIVRIKDDGFQPPLYVEGRIQEVEVEQSTHKIKGFKIGNFIEYKKEDLEKQVAFLKQLIAQRATKKFVQDYSEKKKVLSNTAPEDTNVIWIKPDATKSINIAYAHDGIEWVPLTTTNASDIVEGEMLFDRLRGGKAILGGIGNESGQFEVRDASNVIHTKIDESGIDTNKITIKRQDGFALINDGTANFDFGVDSADPAFMDFGVSIEGYWFKTANTIPSACNFYTFKHTARYLKMQIAFYKTGSGNTGGLRIYGNGGALNLGKSFLSGNTEPAAIEGEVFTLDLGVPTGNMISVYLQAYQDIANGNVFVRKIRAWLEE
jgi:phage minor structural protein